MASKTEAKTAKTTKTTSKSASKSTSKAKSGTKKTLLIVESPSKAKIIGKYLGTKYKVIASVGHVRDLPKSRLAVDVENNFEPDYINIRGKGDVIKALKKEAAAADKVLLATDPDREGEAISWHIAYLLGIDITTPCRVKFNEINKDAVKEAIKHPEPIDMGLVDAQQGRRVLDRLVGYQISPLLWKKVSRGLSAGRVQSAALKIVCDRENEINAFVPKEYWELTADFGKSFEAALSKIAGKKAHVANEEEANAIEAELNEGSYIVADLKNGSKKVRPYAPFTTSSLQQDASSKLGFSTKKTMQIAQQLYEGVTIKGSGARGLVTYIRTDSTRISQSAKETAASFIKDAYGSEYSGNNVYTNKKKAMQDAHEAIRPSDVTLTPDSLSDSLSDSLTPDQMKLYSLIWKRFVASQMTPALYDTSAVLIENGRYEFKASGSRMTFDGWRKVYPAASEKEMTVPVLNKGDVLDIKQLKKEQKFTQPPSRYTEASLVKELEDKNIGRPSTYASIISVLIDRRYVKREKKSLVPSKLGFDVIGILQEYFTDIVDVQFTGEMEDNLDRVEMREIPWKNVIADFYVDFSKELKVAEEEVEKIEKEVIPTGETCELCGAPMVYKEGRFGRFIACSSYPECKNTKPIVKSTGVKCPKCGKDIVEKRGRKSGRVFYGCEGYPDCDVSYWDLPTGDKCPKCGEMIVQTKGRNKVRKCSNANCDYKE